jgi:hypothetical protein
MYTLHEETDADGRAVVGLRNGMTSFCQVTAPSYAAKSFTAALQALAQQLADNIANDATTRSQLDETQIPEPLASVLRACILRRRRQALHNARVWRDVLYALRTPKES